MTDYIILSVETPAFEANIEIMIENILSAGGSSPTMVIKYKDGDPIPDTDPVEFEQIPYESMVAMVGTGVSNGRVMFHFRLPAYYNEADLINFLETGMSAPKPPLSVESIRSAYKILEVDDGEGGIVMEYEITVQAMRAKFLPYMTVDRDGNTNEFLSGYLGSDPIELV